MIAAAITSTMMLKFAAARLANSTFHLSLSPTTIALLHGASNIQFIETNLTKIANECGMVNLKLEVCGLELGVG